MSINLRPILSGYAYERRVRIALFIVSVIGIALGLAIPVAKAPAGAPVTADVASIPRPTDVSPVRVADEKPVDTVLDRMPSGHFITIANVNNEAIRFIVDTGADTVALTMDDARRAHVDFDPGQFQVIGRGASGDVRGQEVRIASIELDGKRADDVRGVVLEGSDYSLLGQTYLRHLSDVHIKNDQMILH